MPRVDHGDLVTHPSTLQPGDTVRIHYNPRGFSGDHDIEAEVVEKQGTVDVKIVQLERGLDDTLNSEVQLLYRDDAFFLEARLPDSEIDGFEQRSEGAVEVEVF